MNLVSDVNSNQRGDESSYSRKLIQRELGWTGVDVSLLGLGGVGIIQEGQDDDVCFEIINEAIDLGINFIDTSPGYKKSEWRVGQVMASRRAEVFLTTKVDRRDYDGIMAHVENSLKVLHTDQLDLLMVHHVSESDDVKAMGEPDGVFSTLSKLKEEGVTRFIGMTGHPQYPKVTEAVGMYDWDAFMCFINPSVYAEEALETQIPLARSKKMGLIGMKAFGGCWKARLIGEDPGQASAPDLLRYALTMPFDRPIDVVIPGVWNLRHLRENVAVAANFEPLAEDMCRALEKWIRGFEKSADWERGEVPED